PEGAIVLCWLVSNRLQLDIAARTASSGVAQDAGRRFLDFDGAALPKSLDRVLALVDAGDDRAGMVRERLAGAFGKGSPAEGLSGVKLDEYILSILQAIRSSKAGRAKGRDKAKGASGKHTSPTA